MSSFATLPLRILVKGRDPRFFRKMVGRPDRKVAPGELVRVVDRAGRPVGFGMFNPRATLALRMVSLGEGEPPADWAVRRLQTAVQWRGELLDLEQGTDAHRLVHAEGDGLPGLILDRLGAFLVAQVHALGIVPHLEELGRWLKQQDPRSQLVLTVDEQARQSEGIELPVSAPQTGELREAGIRYRVLAGGGHKTGFFCDQRENRARFAGLARGRRVLDLCCNSGGFGLLAKQRGAGEVVGFDLDEKVLELAKHNAERNRLDVRFEHGDLFDVLRAQPAGSAEAIVLDPPKWADGPKAVEAALPKYRDANRLALQACARGAVLLTCSCSGALSEERFLQCLQRAAIEAGRDVQVLATCGAGADHPVALECPETRYLKAVFLRVR